MNNSAMARTRIKVCGVMRPEDAAVAAAAGADAIGLVFYPQARRCVTAERAREILRRVPAFVSPVGLFVDQEVEEIRALMNALHLRHVQLHGRETPDKVAALRPFTVIKALKTSRQTLRAELAVWREAVEALDLEHLRGFVLETAVTGDKVPGGTGIDNDWAFVAELRREGAFEGLPPVIAAGGLRPENVAAVVRAVRPWAVDVSSGVEEAFGEKSRAKIEAFVREVGEADRET